MGYYMDCQQVEIVILDRTGALHAIKSMPTSGNGSAGWAWVSKTAIDAATTLEEALAEWRWPCYCEPEDPPTDGLATVIREFTGEKLGDDVLLFSAIAPFVKAGSYAEMRGEDDLHWRWVFDGDTCTEMDGELVWPPVCHGPEFVQHYVRPLRELGYAVIVFNPEELGKLDPRNLEDFLVEHGNEWIAANTTNKSEEPEE